MGINLMQHRLRDAILAGLIVLVGGIFIVRWIGLFVASQYSLTLYLDLLGQTGANLSWKPWWGYWLHWLTSLAVAAILATFAACLWYRNAGLKPTVKSAIFPMTEL